MSMFNHSTSRIIDWTLTTAIMFMLLNNIVYIRQAHVINTNRTTVCLKKITDFKTGADLKLSEGHGKG